MTSDQASASGATPPPVDTARGNSGEGPDPAKPLATEHEDVKDDATGSRAEKDARAFDHPGRAVGTG